MEDTACKKIGDYYYYLNSKRLGRGGFSTVYRGFHVDDEDDIVAIKVISAETFQQYQDKPELFERETKVLLSIRGQHVLKVRKIYKTASNNLYIVTDFCDGGTLEQMIQEKGRFSESEALKILKDICQAFVEIEDLDIKNENGESAMIMHRDIKPANILFQNGETKLADFGFAKFYDKGSKNAKMYHTSLGTPRYMPAQILSQGEYTYKCDIWSMGIVLFEMVTGSVPYSATTQYNLLQKIQNQPINIPEYLSKECRDLLEKMLVVKEADRYDWRDILKHPAMNGKKLQFEALDQIEESKSELLELNKKLEIKKFKNTDPTSDRPQKIEEQPLRQQQERLAFNTQALKTQNSNEEPEQKKYKITIYDQ